MALVVRQVGDGPTAEGVEGHQVVVGDCPAGDPCPPVRWTLRATGRPVQTPLPAFGAPGPPRPVLLGVAAARIG